MKRFVIIITVIIALLIIAMAVSFYIFFLYEAPIVLSSEPKEKDAVIEETLRPIPASLSYRIPGPKDKPGLIHAEPSTKIPSPQEMEERANKAEEKRRTLEEMKLKIDRQNELLRAEACRKLQEDEIALLNAKPEESKKASAAMPHERNIKLPTKEEIEKLRSQGIILN